MDRHVRSDRWNLFLMVAETESRRIETKLFFLVIVAIQWKPDRTAINLGDCRYNNSCNLYDLWNLFPYERYVRWNFFLRSNR